MRTRNLSIPALALALALVPVGAASADDPDDAVDLSLSTEGEFVEIPEDDPYYEGDTAVDACGSTLEISSGHVRDVEYRTTVADDGGYRIAVQGLGTLDVVRESDGARLDELPTTGTSYTEVAADGLTETYAGSGSVIFYSAGAAEAAAFAEEGLPSVFYFTQGYFKETVVYTDDEEADDPVLSAVVEINDVRDAVDLCELLDAAGDDGHIDGLTVEDGFVGVEGDG